MGYFWVLWSVAAGLFYAGLVTRHCYFNCRLRVLGFAFVLLCIDLHYGMLCLLRVLCGLVVRFAVFLYCLLMVLWMLHLFIVLL